GACSGADNNAAATVVRNAVRRMEFSSSEGVEEAEGETPTARGARPGRAINIETAAITNNERRAPAAEPAGRAASNASSRSTRRPSVERNVAMPTAPAIAARCVTDEAAAHSRNCNKQPANAPPSESASAASSSAAYSASNCICRRAYQFKGW